MTGAQLTGVQASSHANVAPAPPKRACAPSVHSSPKRNVVHEDQPLDCTQPRQPCTVRTTDPRDYDLVAPCFARQPIFNAFYLNEALLCPRSNSGNERPQILSASSA